MTTRLLMFVTLFLFQHVAIVAQTNISQNKIVSGNIEYSVIIDGIETLENEKDHAAKAMLKKVAVYMEATTFTLLFNDFSSIFKSNPQAMMSDSDNEISKKIANAFIKVDNIYYSNILKNEYLKIIEIEGEPYIVTLDNHNKDWIITQEKKMILGYECVKAYKTITEYNSIKNEIREFVKQVWFAPNIPFPYGPAELNGLPGVILEGNITDKVFLKASNINLSDSKIEVENTFIGKKISEEKHKTLMLNIKKNNRK